MSANIKNLKKLTISADHYLDVVSAFPYCHNIVFIDQVVAELDSSSNPSGKQEVGPVKITFNQRKLQAAVKKYSRLTSDICSENQALSEMIKSLSILTNRQYLLDLRKFLLDQEQAVYINFGVLRSVLCETESSALPSSQYKMSQLKDAIPLLGTPFIVEHLLKICDEPSLAQPYVANSKDMIQQAIIGFMQAENAFEEKLYLRNLAYSLPLLQNKVNLQYLRDQIGCVDVAWYGRYLEAIRDKKLLTLVKHRYHIQAERAPVPIPQFLAQLHCCMTADKRSSDYLRACAGAQFFIRTLFNSEDASSDLKKNQMGDAIFSELSRQYPSIISLLVPTDSQTGVDGEYLIKFGAVYLQAVPKLPQYWEKYHKLVHDCKAGFATHLKDVADDSDPMILHALFASFVPKYETELQGLYKKLKRLVAVQLVKTNKSRSSPGVGVSRLSSGELVRLTRASSLPGGALRNPLSGRRFSSDAQLPQPLLSCTDEVEGVESQRKVI